MDIKTLIEDLLDWDFTQQEIGKIIGVSQTTVSKIHRGVQDDIGYRHYLKAQEVHKKSVRRFGAPKRTKKEQA